MTPRIMIEEREVAFAGVPSGAVHLYLVYRGADGAEFVLRSGPRSDLPIDTEMEIEANVPIARSEDARGSDTPAERSSTVLSFPGSADTAWAIMVKYARMLDDVDYGYNVFEENSNSFIGALLFAAGGAPSRMLPTGTSASEAFGFSNWGRIIGDVPPPANGTLYGTSGPDSLVGMQIRDVIRAGGGDDSVDAGAGSDRVYGGAASDLMHGRGGNDRLEGGTSADTLWGDSGNDWVIGGTGSDRLVGGSGADTFEFFAGDGRDRVDYFVPGTDRLLIHTTLAEDFDDLAVTQSDADVRIALGPDTILLRDLDADDLGSADVLIA